LEQNVIETCQTCLPEETLLLVFGYPFATTTNICPQLDKAKSQNNTLRANKSKSGQMRENKSK
jgi:hypothetical protein